MFPTIGRNPTPRDQTKPIPLKQVFDEVFWRKSFKTEKRFVVNVTDAMTFLLSFYSDAWGRNSTLNCNAIGQPSNCTMKLTSPSAEFWE